MQPVVPEVLPRGHVLQPCKVPVGRDSLGDHLIHHCFPDIAAELLLPMLICERLAPIALRTEEPRYAVRLIKVDHRDQCAIGTLGARLLRASTRAVIRSFDKFALADFGPQSVCETDALT